MVPLFFINSGSPLHKIRLIHSFMHQSHSNSYDIILDVKLKLSSFSPTPDMLLILILLSSTLTELFIFFFQF